MPRSLILVLLMAALASGAERALAADTYPVSGRWTYENASASGPAAECAGRTMAFRGAQRFDSVGGVSQYRNVRVEQSASSAYRVVDEFFNVQIRGRVGYTLRIRDKDHVEIKYDRGGSVVLRRCA